MRNGENITKIQRKDQILKALLEKGNVEVRQISNAFQVSEATIRRDLRQMADEGLLELVYGGATLPRKGNYPIAARKTRNVEAKRLIGRLAAQLVQPGDSIFIDSGTTCACMAPYLIDKQDVTVITNSNAVAADIGSHSNLNVLQLGGKFRHERMDSVGPFAQMVMEQLSGFRAFVGADGLDLRIGLTCTDIDTAHLYRAVIQHASESILLADHTKFSAPALYKIIEIDAIDRLVSDRRPPEEWAGLLNDKGIEMIAPTTEESTPNEGS
ncbi:MAG: DeoR/GlpR family DNA-binding transcription regulator [Candidatus Sumerlaeia bacterium]